MNDEKFTQITGEQVADGIEFVELNAESTEFTPKNDHIAILKLKILLAEYIAHYHYAEYEETSEVGAAAINISDFIKYLEHRRNRKLKDDACTPDGGEKTTLGGKIIEALQKEWANSSKDEEDYRTGLAVATRIVMETAAGAK